MATLILRPRDPLWDEVRRRYALIGILPYEGPGPFASLIDTLGSDACFSCMEDDGQGFFSGGFLTGTLAEWPFLVKKAALEMVAIDPTRDFFRTTMFRAKPTIAQQRAGEKFVWRDLAAVDRGAWGTGRIVELRVSAVLARLTAVVV